jgi:alkylation response protein AidB-like acyl-CoA dehydrogenase
MAHLDLRAAAEAELREMRDAYLQGTYTESAFLEERFDRGLAWLWAPSGRGGRGIAGRDQRAVENELWSTGCPDPRVLNIMGYAAAGPAIIEHGSAEQADRWLRPLFSGRETWCQMFSEPDAGSDLSSITTTAKRCEGGWLLTGLKTWSSGADKANWGLVLANAGDEGLTAFAVNMSDRGVVKAPVRQMTGAYGFCEVALDSVFVAENQVLGRVGGGFRVLLTATGAERQVFCDRAGWDMTLLLTEWRAATAETRTDSMRQEIVKMWSEDQLQGVSISNGVKATSRSLQGAEAALLGKLRQTRLNQRIAELRVAVAGADAMLVRADGYQAADGARLRRDEDPAASLLASRGDTIAGGGTEVLLNMIAERVLGLPGENKGVRPIPRGLGS